MASKNFIMLIVVLICLGEKVDAASKLTFADNVNLLQQRITGNKVDQMCSCMKPNGGDKCVPYDTRFQAATLAEAMIFFPDLSFGDPSNSDRSSFSDFNCQSYECQQCAGTMLTRFRKIGLLGATETGGINVRAIPEEQSRCAQLRFLNPQTKLTPPPPAIVPAYMQETIRVAKQYWKQTHGGQGRKRRAAAEEKVIGTRFAIDPGSCIQKGQSIKGNGNDDELSLCSSCWVIRKLPAGYFPPFLNEVVCKDTRNVDLSCLSGAGACMQRYRALHVVRKDDQGHQHDETIYAAVCCDCRIQAGTPFQALVAGDLKN